jgi:hypothetical protein
LDRSWETLEKARLPRAPRAAMWTGIGTAVVYGLAFRLLFTRSAWNDLFGVMTLAFLFVVPFVIGFLTVHVGDRDGRWSWPRRLFLPWAPATISLAVALLLAWEGLICIVIWLPLFLVLSLLGGLVAALVGRAIRNRRASALVASCIALLPAVLSPLERRFAAGDELRGVGTEIEIAAAPEIVWREISRVRKFEPAEHRFAWTHAIGFPRPVEATLSREGIGGVRLASFEGGVVFVETITVWEPERRLAFQIAADPDAIPARALDEHVTVGGPFFDVLEGEYRIEPLDGGRVRLHLASRHRLTTHFNAYAALWTDFILEDTQRYILEALKRRCEGTG